MNEPQRVLRNLSPPPGGWQRLLARRDAPPRWVRQWLPLAAGGAGTLLLLALLMPQPQLNVQWPGARAAGADLVPLDRQRISQLPSDDPRVRLYWLEAAPDASPKQK